VLATLHTNDAASAVTRLADMGVEPYLLASSLLGVLAQRLVRTLCPACRVPVAPSEGEGRLLDTLGLASAHEVWNAKGCDACNHTGYSGRTGVYELLKIDDTLRRLIHDGAGELALRDAALRAGMQRLRADGARWIAGGRTSLAELARVTRDS
jgi:general secretion pathway protein E